MDFEKAKKDFRVKVGVRAFLLMISGSLLLNHLGDSPGFVTIALLSILIIYQFSNLFTFLEDLKNLPESQGYEKETKKSNSTKSDEGITQESDSDLHSFDFKSRHLQGLEKEAHYQYLKTIVQHIGIGLITFNKKGEIQIMNSAAKKLLKVTQADNIDEFIALHPQFVEIFKRLRTGGRELLKFEQGGDLLQISIYAIELSLQGEEFKLISLQNIQSELEEKEMEAWQNLIRVLTHEIMNSVTPISSLATTVEEDLAKCLNQQSPENHVSSSDLEDMHLAMKTIHKRSDGLIRFVTDFRNLTRIPNPRFQTTSVKQLFEQTHLLMKNEIAENNVTMECDVQPADLELTADPELIEQVLINLIKNASQALSDYNPHSGLRVIKMKAFQDEKERVYISISDNGPGIDEEAQAKLFIPFFTTKKNGSGIGLSLSRQIMRQHKGSISVKSVVNEGSEFILKF
jgi:two-component system, NtrC family, nitrogen regulation sensor histidine kinase NtrY